MSERFNNQIVSTKVSREDKAQILDRVEEERTTISQYVRNLIHLDFDDCELEEATVGILEMLSQKWLEAAQSGQTQAAEKLEEAIGEAFEKIEQLNAKTTQVRRLQDAVRQKRQYMKALSDVVKGNVNLGGE